MELPPNQVFHTVAAISSIYSSNTFYAFLLDNFWYQIQATFIGKWSQWNYQTKTISEMPLAERGTAGAPLLSVLFHAFAASSTILSDNINSLQDSQATFNTNFKKNIFLTLHSALFQWNYHTGTAPGRAEQSCTTLAFFSFMQLLLIMAFLA